MFLVYSLPATAADEILPDILEDEEPDEEPFDDGPSDNPILSGNDSNSPSINPQTGTPPDPNLCSQLKGEATEVPVTTTGPVASDAVNKDSEEVSPDDRKRKKSAAGKDLSTVLI
jgi:hypothetical protein